MGHVSSSSLRTSGIIFGRHLGAHLGLHSIRKLESGSDNLGCVRRIKVCSIPEIFLYCVETKEYFEENETLETFFTKMRQFFENFW